MNPEYKRGWSSTLKNLFIVFIAMVYWLAGRGTRVFGVKLYRRWLIPILLVTGTMGFSLVQGSFSFYYLLALPLYMGVYHIGYGSTSILRRLLGVHGQRALIGFLRGICSLPFAYINGMWLVFGFQVVLAMAGQVILGSFNPIEAAEEENNICIFDTILVPFMILWG